MAAVRPHYAERGAKNKDEIARMIAKRFPELRSSLPPRRKPWMPEDERMATFDAAALALAAFDVRVPTG
jgi:hypothetical protein